jgi:hypothetical protein
MAQVSYGSGLKGRNGWHSFFWAVFREDMFLDPWRDLEGVQSQKGRCCLLSRESGIGSRPVQHTIEVLRGIPWYNAKGGEENA